MNEFINKQSALDLVREKCHEILDRCDSHYDVDVEDYVYDDQSICNTILTCNKEIQNGLSEMPTIDAVPVIRCKDCKYLGDYESYGHYCENDNYVTTGEEFCSWAERKEE